MTRMAASTLILRRLALLPVTLVAVVTVAFVLMRAAPGGPFDLERPLDPAVMENLAHVFRLDEPLWRQYLDYLVALAHGDLRPSFGWRDYSVGDLLAKALPISFGLGAAALLLALVVGSAAGIVAAGRPGTALDRLVTAAASFGLVVPNFVLAPLAQLVFGLWLGWLPVGGWNGGAVANRVLPILILAAPQIAAIARLTRAAMIEALAAPSSRTLRAYGLPRKTVLAHAFRAAMLPLISYLGPAAAGLTTGSVVVETIFGIPGVGRYFVEAALNRDYTLAMGVAIVVAAAIIVFNLLVDVAYALIDPRIRHD
jgi:oligopeptide transport system permease protein